MNFPGQQSLLEFLPSDEDKNLSINQCDIEIKRLSAIHKQKVTDFWASLAKGDVALDPKWTAPQVDLYRLFNEAKSNRMGQLPEPDGHFVKAPYDAVIAQMDEGLQEELKTNFFSGVVLVALITRGDDLLMVHRYESHEIYGIAEDDLSVGNGEGLYWFYEPSMYEPTGYRSSAYGEVNIYVVGCVDLETGEWVPSEMSEIELSQLRTQVHDMEALVDHSQLPSWSTWPLPAYPSGVEARLRELHDLRAWLSHKAIHRSTLEQEAVRAAGSTFDRAITSVQDQISSLTEELKLLQARRETAKLEAFVHFFGFEVGQQLVHKEGEQAGELQITKGERPCLVVVEEGGAVPEKLTWSKQHAIEHQIRAGEWSPSQKEALRDSPSVA